jgi:hypothetical protein
VTPDVAAAIAEIRQIFADHPIGVEEEGQGGEYVTVRNLKVGEPFKPSSIWLGFLNRFNTQTLMFTRTSPRRVSAAPTAGRSVRASPG